MNVAWDVEINRFLFWIGVENSCINVALSVTLAALSSPERIRTAQYRKTLESLKMGS